MNVGLSLAGWRCSIKMMLRASRLFISLHEMVQVIQ